MMRNPRFPRGLGRPQSSPLVLQRRLTLDDFQLDHRPMDVPGNMEKARREKAARAEGIKNARAESGNLREYSRRQFQTVVDHESSLSPQQKTSPPPSSLRRAPPPPPLRPVTVSGYARQHTYVSSSVVPPSTPTNGPTKDGSVLYNGALESLRCRPKSEPAGRFDHLRRAYTNYPTIQRVLEQSNCEYRLVATPRKKVRDADKKEFIFIPASSPDFYSDMFDYDDVISSTPRDSRNEAWSTDPLALSVAAKDKVAGGEGHSEMESSTGSVEGRLVNGRPETLAESGSPQQAPPPSAAASARGRSPSACSKATRLSDPRKSGPRPSSELSESSTMSSVSITPRPHCWVDDATVSSDESVAERDLRLSADAEGRGETTSSRLGDAPGGQGQGQGQGQDPGLVPLTQSASWKRLASSGNKARGSQVALKKDKEKDADPAAKARPSCPRSLKQSSAGGSGSKRDERAASHAAAEMVVVDEEDDDVKLVKALPRFVCPSSETKSRQVATKEWLRKNSFRAACRTVPIM